MAGEGVEMHMQVNWKNSFEQELKAVFLLA